MHYILMIRNTTTTTGMIGARIVEATLARTFPAASNFISSRLLLEDEVADLRGGEHDCVHGDHLQEKLNNDCMRTCVDGRFSQIRFYPSANSALAGAYEQWACRPSTFLARNKFALGSGP